MRRFRLLFTVVIALGLSLGISGAAFALNATSCGMCHGVLGYNGGSGNALEGKVRTGYVAYSSTVLHGSGVAAGKVVVMPYEDAKMPVDPDNCGNGRGLHGVHMNYSSPTYGKTGATRGNCDYCHASKKHENGFINFSGYRGSNFVGQVSTVTVGAGGTGYAVNDVLIISGGDGTATISVKTVTAGAITALNSVVTKGRNYVVANGAATTNAVGTGTGATLNITAVGNTGLRQSVNSVGVRFADSNGNVAGYNTMGLDTMGNGNGTCSTACHKGTSATNLAPWGNITAVNMKLNCNSCHGDATDIALGAVDASGNITVQPSLSSPVNYSAYSHTYALKGHQTHLAGSWSHMKIKFGKYTATGIYLDAQDGSTCQLCHPDNTADRWKNGRKDDGTVKAYPHAKDGTNVIATNAVIGGEAGVTLVNYSATSAANGNFGCTSLCHANTGSALGGKTITWNDNGASHCETCHNHTATAAVNDQAGVKLTYAHSLHFTQIQAMMGRAASCDDCHVATHANNYAGVVGITQLPVLPGAAGMKSTAGWSVAQGTLSVSGTCTNTCHPAASPAWNTIATSSQTSALNAGCATCHSYPGATTGAGDWNTTTKVNGHTIRASALQFVGMSNYSASLKHLNRASAYSASLDTYSSVTKNVNMCGKCHKGAVHMNGVINVADNNTLGTNCNPSFTFNARTTLSTPAATHSNATCDNAKCHFGRRTPNWN